MTSLPVSIALVVLIPVITSGSRILLIPYPHKGHVNMFSVTASSLHKAGHNVDMLVPEDRKSMAERDGVNVITFPVTPEGKLMLSEDMFSVVSQASDLFELFRTITVSTIALFEGALQNSTLMAELETRRYDIAIVDGFDVGRVLYIIPYALGLKYVTLTARHDPLMAGVPFLPSVEHLPAMGIPITEHSTIFERIKNTFISIMTYRMMPPAVLDDSLIVKYAPTRPKATFSDLFRNSEMWIVNLDIVCLDWPRAHGNHYQFTSGLSLTPPKPLPEDLEEFFQGAKAGVILLTFGSGLKNIPRDMLEKMLEAFSQIDQRVIMRHGGEVSDKVPPNVKMMSWVPQGDILAHPKTKAFITHGGGNGQAEALYNAVPMITLPMFGDQPYNAHRASERGFGITLDKDSFTSEQLLQAILTVTKDRNFRNRMRQCSEKLRNLPSAQDTVLFWVEHVIRFGSDHLRPVSMEVPIWQMFMLDILALFMFVILVVYTVVLYACSRLYRRLSRAKQELPMKKSQ